MAHCISSFGCNLTQSSVSHWESSRKFAPTIFHSRNEVCGIGNQRIGVEDHKPSPTEGLNGGVALTVEG